MMGDILVVAVDDETPGPGGRVPARLKLEMTVTVCTTSDTSVWKLDRILRSHREEHDRVGRDTQPKIFQFLGKYFYISVLNAHYKVRTT